MARVVLALSMVATVVVLAWLGRPRPLEFAASLDSACAEAGERGALVVVHLRHPDRPLGARMDRELGADREFARETGDGFVHARLDAVADAALVESLLEPGAALSTLVLDLRREVIARRDGHAAPAELAAFLVSVRELAPEIESCKRAIDDGTEVAARRIDLAGHLMELGALDRAAAQLRLVLAAGGTLSATIAAQDRLAHLLILDGRAAAARAELTSAQCRLEATRVLDAGDLASPALAAECDRLAQRLDVTEARLLLLERREEDAAALLRAVLDRYPPPPLAEEARALLEEAAPTH
jgi:hypothetical protein